MGETDPLRAGAADAGSRERRRQRRLLQEFAVRASLAGFVLVFHELSHLSTGTSGNAIVRALALVGVGLNVPYYFAARTWRWPRAQAYGRMLLDIVLITVGLASAGGLAAAPYLGVYTIVPLYVGLVFSSVACLVASGVATGAYLGLALLQHAGWLSLPAASPVRVWPVVAFNLFILNVVGGLTALLAEAYRRSRLRLAALNQELERAHDQALRLNADIQRGAQLGVLGEVVAGVTHELGNVLTVAFGHVGLVRRKVAGSAAEIDQHLGQIEQSLDAAMRIIRTTLHTARASSDRTATAIPELARRILELKGYDLRRDGVAVRVDFPERFPTVSAVPFQIQQVLLNLVTNAQHALRDAPDPRVLEVVGRVGQGQVVVEVRDTGPGIAAEALPRVFEPFFTTKADGTGLGLAISAGIVRGLGGELTAENRPARGAVFRMTLPTEAARPSAAAAGPKGSAASS